MSKSGFEEWQRIDDTECLHSVAVFETVGKRWSGGILLALARGAERFSDMLAAVRGLSSRMLALRLRELEEAGLVDRDVSRTMPVTVRYRLTPQGRELLAALQPVARYAGKWAPAGADAVESSAGAQIRA